MGPHTRDIAGVATANLEIALVFIERLGDSRHGISDGNAVVTIPSNGANPVLRLPEREDFLPVGLGEIVGYCDGIGPVAPSAVRNSCHPTSGCRIPAIA